MLGLRMLEKKNNAAHCQNITLTLLQSSDQVLGLDADLRPCFRVFVEVHHLTQFSAWFACWSHLHGVQIAE